LATDAYRRRRLLRWLPLRESDGRVNGPERVVAERDAVARALRALPPKYRVPLVLYTTEGWTVAEVARALELSESAVKMRLCRARKMFRSAYETGEGS
jgi:RNA polymerase sigma-70 factor (ECF subfamily)